MIQLSVDFKHTRKLSKKDNYFIIEFMTKSKEISIPGQAGWIGEKFEKKEFEKEYPEIKVISYTKCKSKEEYEDWKNN